MKILKIFLTASVLVLPFLISYEIQNQPDQKPGIQAQNKPVQYELAGRGRHRKHS